MPSLRREEVVTIQVLSAKQVLSRAIARQLEARAGRATTCGVRARAPSTASEEKAFAATVLADAIDAWGAGHVGERSVNALELHDHLLRVHGYRAVPSSACPLERRTRQGAARVAPSSTPREDYRS